MLGYVCMWIDLVNIFVVLLLDFMYFILVSVILIIKLDFFFIYKSW